MPHGGSGVTDNSFWKDKRVLITGHTGFKGSWLSIWLSSIGAEVFGVALNPQSTPSLFHEAKVSDHVTSFIGDIRNLEFLSKVISDAQPEIIFHLAAQPLVRYSYEQPEETFSTNIMGTVNIFEAARRSGNVQAIVNITSDKCYENNEWIWPYKENDKLGGIDPYSSSKACSEIISNAYYNSFFKESGTAIASARAGNVIGGGDWAEDRLIPDILRSFEDKKKVIIRYPLAIRPWQHVLEPLAGYLTLAEQLFKFKNQFSGPWNFGPYDHDAKNVEWIVCNMAKRWKTECGWIKDNELNPHEATYLKLDISKALNFLDWKPVWNIEKSLEKIIEWHLDWINGQSAKDICLRQIKDYTKQKHNQI